MHKISKPAIGQTKSSTLEEKGLNENGRPLDTSITSFKISTTFGE
jgi:hypothetical protein